MVVKPELLCTQILGFFASMSKSSVSIHLNANYCCLGVCNCLFAGCEAPRQAESLILIRDVRTIACLPAIAL